MARTLLNEWQREKLLRLADEGVSYRAIGERFGIDRKQVSNQVYLLRRTPDHKYQGAAMWDSDDLAVARALSKRGVSRTLIGRLLGRSKGSVTGKLWRENGKRSTTAN